MAFTNGTTDYMTTVTSAGQTGKVPIINRFHHLVRSVTLHFPCLYAPCSQ